MTLRRKLMVLLAAGGMLGATASMAADRGALSDAQARFMVLLAAGGMLGVTASMAADRGALSGAQARYQSERAACLAGQTSQYRATCIKEAGAALHEARRGNFREEERANYEQNRLARCGLQSAEDRPDCIRRMSDHKPVARARSM